jgi:hypothetical protein
VVSNYETGGGEIGNVDPNTITEIVGSIYDETGQYVLLLVRNPSNASGGVDRMNVEEARVAIPESVRGTTGRVTITRDHFEINSRAVRGVARALALTSDEEPLIPEYTAYVYIVPVGGGLPSAVLKADVLTMLTVTRPPPVGMTVEVKDPPLKIISLTAKVYLEDDTTEAEARANIEDNLDAFFALELADGSPNPQIDFGFNVKQADGTPASEVPRSDLFNAVRDAVGVRKVDFSTFIPAADVTLALDEFPVLGSITLINGDTSSYF